MCRPLQRISGDEIVSLKKIAAELEPEEHHREKRNQEDREPVNIVDCVVRVEGNAVQWPPLRILVGLDLDAVRIVRNYVVQRDDVRDHQTQQQ